MPSFPTKNQSEDGLGSSESKLGYTSELETPKPHLGCLTLSPYNGESNRKENGK